MIIKIDMNSNKSIHKQLEQELKYGIVTNQLKANEQLPSIRTLAGDLGINMHTVNKVYKALEAENIISKNRYGFYVKDLSKNECTDQDYELIKETILEPVIFSKLVNVSKEKLVNIIDDIYTIIEKEKSTYEQ